MKKQISKDLLIPHRKELAIIITHTEVKPVDIIARYAFAFEHEPEWLTGFGLFVRGPFSRHILNEEMLTSFLQKRTTLLGWFAGEVNATPDKRARLAMKGNIHEIREMFSYPAAIHAGLLGLAMCTALEDFSDIYIPELRRCRKRCGETKNEHAYTERFKKSKTTKISLFQATDFEMRMGYSEPLKIIDEGFSMATRLIGRIWTKVD